MSKRIVVIDGNSLMHRAFHAIPSTMIADDGRHTNAVFGFLSMLYKMVEVLKPDAFVCAFDRGRPEFRIKALGQYKAQRPPMDKHLHEQFAIIEEVLDSLGIPVVVKQGWEGDDILATIAAKNEDQGFETLLVSGDRDIYQLTNELTKVVTTKKGISDIAIIGPKEVEEKYGVRPDQIPDYLGIKGDSSDNIPGVAGIGEKGAAKLLKQFDNLDGIYKNIEQIKGKQKEYLENSKDIAYISKKVATIVRDLEFDQDLNCAEISFPTFDAGKVNRVFSKYKLFSQLKKFLALEGKALDSQKIKFNSEKILEGDVAKNYINKNLKNWVMEDNFIALSIYEKQQRELFGQESTFLAIDDGLHTLFIEEDIPEIITKLIKAKVYFACLNFKNILNKVFPFDCFQLFPFTNIELIESNYLDCSVAAYCIKSNLKSYGLDVLCMNYLNFCIPEPGENDKETVCFYSQLVHMLKPKLDEALKEDGVIKLYEKFDLPLVAVLLLVERAGVAIDVDFLAVLSRETHEKLNKLEEEIFCLAGENFNIASPKQLGHILFDVLGLRKINKTKTGYSTSHVVLNELALVHPLPKKVLEYRELSKIANTYLDTLPKMRTMSGDQRIHCSFNQTVTTTGRLSSSDPNLQNIPVRTEFGRQVRKSFLPHERDEFFVSADYSQIELRLLAHLSGDKVLIEAFKTGKDFHSSTAAKIFDLDIESVDSALRSKAKAVNFGIVYGQQAFGLSKSLGIPFEEAQNFIDKYFETYPKVREYLEFTVKEAYKNSYVSTMFGRRRYIPELFSSNGVLRKFGERTAMNHPMQGSAADIIKLAMIRIFDKLNSEKFRSKMILQVHDELCFSVKHNELERFKLMVKNAMENVVELKVPLVVEMNHASNWADAH